MRYGSGSEQFVEALVSVGGAVAAIMMIVGSIKSLISGSYVSRTRGGNFFVEIAGTEARLLAVFFLLCGLAILACCVLYWIERFRR